MARPRSSLRVPFVPPILIALVVGVGLGIPAPASAQGSCPNPAAAWSVSGTVTAGGAGLMGADIDILDNLGNPLLLSQDFTLADGSFTLFVCDVIPAGPFYTLIVNPPPGAVFFPSETTGVNIFDGVTIPPITLDPASIVSGVVVDEQGIGIEEVDLEFVDSQTGLPVAFSGDVTETGGVFSVFVDPGTYDIRFREVLGTFPPGPYVPTQLLERPLQTSLDLGTVVLRTGYILGGTVTDNGGSPLPLADVDVRDPVTGDEILIDDNDDVTGPAGTVSMLVPTGTWELEIEPPAGSSLVAQLVTSVVTAPGPNSFGTISLPLGVPVSGTTRAPGGAAVPSVDLDFIITATGTEIATADDNADASGNFSVQVVPDTYDIQFKPSFPTGLAPLELSSVVVSGPTPLGDVTLPLGNSLSGTITEGGSPVEGARVTLASGGSEVVVFGNRSGPLGTYALRQVPGPYDVTVTPPPGSSALPVTVLGVDLSSDQVLDVDLGAGPLPPPPILSLDCTATGPDVTLTWTLGAPDYDSIEVDRDGVLQFTLPGQTSMVTDLALPDGIYQYTVRPVRAGLPAPEVACNVIVGTMVDLPFTRGDSNGDGTLDIADAIGILNGLFVPSIPPATCQDAEDGNDDGMVNIADAVYVLAYLFAGSTPPPAPFPGPGDDPTPDSLVCL